MSDSDLEEGGELGFAPAVPVTGDDSPVAPPRAATAKPRRRARGKWHRRLGGTLALLIALTGVGALYTAFASSSSAEEGATTASAAENAAAGQSIYQTACITCHGANLEGVTGRGPSLVGVGQAATYYQVSTGRMPVARQEAQVPRKDPSYTDEQVEQIAAYVETYGGGPSIPSGSLRASSDDLAEGGQLFRLNCAQCHGFSGKGAPLSAGKYAPGLELSTDKQIYGAMLSGPENMPVFNDNQLTPDQKRMVIDYVQTLKAQKDPGGAGIGRIGPVSEGLVIWIVGVGLLMGIILWIGRKTA
ncbi:cytochrome bc1 complex diheme cytochrome c subunit [Jatrophihabitans sp. YIM 134969]